MSMTNEWRDYATDLPPADVADNIEFATMWRMKPEPPKPREWLAVPMGTDSEGADCDYRLKSINDTGWNRAIHVREVLP